MKGLAHEKPHIQKGVGREGIGSWELIPLPFN
jgi:hypothetical protein